VLFEVDFRKDPFLVPEDFSYFQVPEVYVADDGIATQDASGLTINSTPFTKRSFQILDHTKYLVITNKQFPIPGHGLDLSVETRMSYSSTGLTQDGVLAPGIQKYSPTIANIKDEPRVSAGALNALDLATGMIFDFIFSDSTIYALYEHLPVSDDTSVFTYAVPIYARQSVEEDVDLKITFSRKSGDLVVKWFINGIQRFSVSDVGLPLVDQVHLVLNGGGTPHKVNINSIQFGFGTFTLLDFFPFSLSYEQIGQSFTTFDDGQTLSKVQPLANLGSIYFQRMKDQLGNNVPQTAFTYEGPQEQDGNGAVIRLTNIKVAISSCRPICKRYADDCHEAITKVHVHDMTKHWKIKHGEEEQ
jgi:hypothetical protein